MNNSVNYGWIRLDRWYCCKIIRYKDGICTVGIGDAIIDDVPCNELQPINGCKLPWENELNNLSSKTCAHVELNAF